MDDYFSASATALCRRVLECVDRRVAARARYATVCYAAEKLLRQAVTTWAVARPLAFDEMWPRLLRTLVVERGFSLADALRVSRHLHRVRSPNALAPTPSIDVLCRERRALLTPLLSATLPVVLSPLVSLIIDADERRIRGGGDTV